MEIKDGGMTTTLPDTTPVMTYDEWITEGKRLFGDDFQNWKFKCPICANVAAVSDYQKYKDQGANPNSATCECIGRYQGAHGFAKGGKGPCDYAAYGLFRIPGVVVETADGKKIIAFAFSD
jgi:hypothetical protein